MPEKHFIITLAADKLTPELEALLNAQGAEIRTTTSERLYLSPEREADLVRDLEALEAGEEGLEVETVVAEGRAIIDSDKQLSDG